MRDLQSTWHAAFWAVVCLFAQLIFAANARADDPPGTRIISVRSVYTFADGRKVVVEESTEATKAAAAASSNGCQKCGDKCDCVGGCGCEATSWLATCGAAPVARAKVPCDAQGNALPVTHTAPPIIYPTAAPAYYLPPVYESPHGYQPMPAAPVTSGDVWVQPRPYQFEPAVSSPAPTIERPPVYSWQGNPTYYGPGFGQWGGTVRGPYLGTRYLNPAPPAGFSAGVQFRGPRGGGFGASACVGGT